MTIETLQPAIDTMSNIANLSPSISVYHPAQFGAYRPRIAEGRRRAEPDRPTLTPTGAGICATPSLTPCSSFLGRPWKRPPVRHDPSRRRPRQTLARRSAWSSWSEMACCVSQGGQASVIESPGSADPAGQIRQARAAGFAPLAEENNDQGAVEMGAVAEFLPGPAPLNDQAARDRIATVWREEFPRTPGASLIEMLAGCKPEPMKALFIVGENPVGSLPAAAQAKEAPRASWTCWCARNCFSPKPPRWPMWCCRPPRPWKNTEPSRIRRTCPGGPPAIDPVGDSRPDWEILSAISVLHGFAAGIRRCEGNPQRDSECYPRLWSLGPTPMTPKVDPAAY